MKHVGFSKDVKEKRGNSVFTGSIKNKDRLLYSYDSSTGKRGWTGSLL
jgi:hypothetical protein